MPTQSSIDSLLAFNLTPNRILVKPDNRQHFLEIAGIKMAFDTRFNLEKHAPVTGKVVNVCKELDWTKMEWCTDHNIQTGDDCIYSYTSALYSLDEMKGRSFIDENHDIYLLLDYEDIFAVKRNQELIPVNGFMFVSPVIEDIKSAIRLPDYIENQESAKLGVVEYLSPKNSFYVAAGKVRNDVYDINDDIKPGDMVLFSQHSDIPLEFGLHKTTDKKLFRMQRRDILAIL